MLNLSEEPDEENIDICKKYLTRMAPMDQILEMEIGITGGVEDGVDNSSVSKDKLYSRAPGAPRPLGPRTLWPWAPRPLRSIFHSK